MCECVCIHLCLCVHICICVWVRKHEFRSMEDRGHQISWNWNYGRYEQFSVVLGAELKSSATTVSALTPWAIPADLIFFKWCITCKTWELLLNSFKCKLWCHWVHIIIVLPIFYYRSASVYLFIYTEVLRITLRTLNFLGKCTKLYHQSLNYHMFMDNIISSSSHLKPLFN